MPKMDVRETVDHINKWLHTEGVDLKDQRMFVDSYCNKLREQSLPVDRLFISAVVLHPLVAAKAWKWEASGEITEKEWSRVDYYKFAAELATNEEAEMTNSPIYQFMMGAKSVYIKVTDDDIPPDCEWMAREHYTELYGLASPGAGSGDGIGWSLESAENGRLEGGFTWSTKDEKGFTQYHLEVLNETVYALNTVLRLFIARSTSLTLLKTYLGEDAGTRVHRGEIERGEGLTIRSVIWFSDVRGFTAMSGALDRHKLVDLINSVFEVTQKVVRQHQGQVLKYMGDGCMAIFTDQSFQRTSMTFGEKQDMDQQQGAKVCHRARLAAAQVQESLAQLKVEREEKGLCGCEVGVGLHYGDVSYGNVGAPERLDFTVLGPHVNLASRTESLCGKLGAKVLATQAFVKLDGDEFWESRGNHLVKGIAEPVPIYELHGMISK